MAIFDGIGDLIPAPDDKGIHDDDGREIPLVPLPKSVVIPKVRDAEYNLPDDQIDSTNVGIELDDDGAYFPDENINLTPVKEDVVLPIGVTMTPEVEALLFPQDALVPEIEEEVSIPDGVDLPEIEEGSLGAPDGGIIPVADEDSPLLPISSGGTSPLDPDFVGAPVDVNPYTVIDDFDGSLDGIVLSPSGINYSDTIIDRLFTKATDILDFIRVPVPQSIESLYTKIQEIEGYLSDPKSFAIQVRENVLGLLLGPNTEDRFDPKIGLIKIPKNARGSLMNVNWGQYDLDGTKEAAARNAELIGIENGENLLTEGYVKEERMKEISDDIRESQFAFQGRKSTVGVTLRLNHLWDLAFEPYSDPKLGIQCVLPSLFNHISTAYDNKKNQVVTESYLERDKDGNSIRENPVADWEDSMPILSYDLDYMSLASRDLELYGGSTISIPEIIKRNSLLTTQVLDDENKRWRRWFQRALDTICPPAAGEQTASGAQNGSIVVPYKNACMKATLYQYRTDSHILSHKVFLVLLKNYQVISSGAGGGAGTPDILDIEWSIVGEITQYAGQPERKFPNRSAKKRLDAQRFKNVETIDGIEQEESKKYPGKYINIV